MQVNLFTVKRNLVQLAHGDSYTSKVTNKVSNAEYFLQQIGILGPDREFTRVVERGEIASFIEKLMLKYY
jgi:hypothetical protein